MDFGKSKIECEVEYNDETKFELEKALLEKVKQVKREIRKYPIEVQNEIEKDIYANIIYNSEALAGDTLPKEVAIPYIKSLMKSGNGTLFRE